MSRMGGNRGKECTNASRQPQPCVSGRFRGTVTIVRAPAGETRREARLLPVVAVGQSDFDDVEAEENAWPVEKPHPFARAADDQPLFFEIDSKRGPAVEVGGARFYFGEDERFPIAAGDVDLAAFRRAEVAIENPAPAFEPEPACRRRLPEAPNPVLVPLLPFSSRSATGRLSSRSARPRDPACDREAHLRRRESNPLAHGGEGPFDALPRWLRARAGGGRRLSRVRRIWRSRRTRPADRWCHRLSNVRRLTLPQRGRSRRRRGA